jgi:hypothetical protein
MSDLSDLWEEIDRLRAINAELVEALEALFGGAGEGVMFSERMEKARVALAKAKERP